MLNILNCRATLDRALSKTVSQFWYWEDILKYVFSWFRRKQYFWKILLIIMGRKLYVYVCIRTCVHACMCLCVMQATHSDILQASISLKSKGTEFGDAALLLTAWVQGCMGLPSQRGCFRGIRQLSWPPFPNDPLISETPTGLNQPHGFTLPEQYQLVPLLPFLRAPVPRISVMAPNSPPYSRQCP